MSSARLRAALDAAGFDLSASSSSSSAGTSNSSGGSASNSAELAAQEQKESAALRELTAAALEAADSLAEFDTYLRESAVPAARALRDESAEMRTHLQEIASIGVASESEDIT